MSSEHFSPSSLENSWRFFCLTHFIEPHGRVFALCKERASLYFQMAIVASYVVVVNWPDYNIIDTIRAECMNNVIAGLVAIVNIPQYCGMLAAIAECLNEDSNCRGPGLKNAQRTLVRLCCFCLVVVFVSATWEEWSTAHPYFMLLNLWVQEYSHHFLKMT